MMLPTRDLIIYILKCILGCMIVFILSEVLHYADISWTIISVMLVLTPDNNEALPLAVTRIKANIIGGIVSLLVLFLVSANPVSITIAIVLTVFCCFIFNLMAGSRAAIAAVIIIMMHGLEFNEPDFWKTTSERMVSVIAGCIIGLLVTLIFHRKYFMKPDDHKPDEA